MSDTERRAPINISTLGDLIDHRYTMTAYCNQCRHRRDVDLVKAAERLGRDRSYIGGLPLRCTVCGSRDVAMSILPPYR